MTGSQRWKTVLVDLIMWLIYCNFVCFFPILLIWQMAQPSSGSTHTSKYKELIQRLRSATPTQPKGHCEPSSSLQSLRRAGRLCTPGKPSQGNIWAWKQSEDETRVWNKTLECSTSVCLLLFIQWFELSRQRPAACVIFHRPDHLWGAQGSTYQV